MIDPTVLVIENNNDWRLAVVSALQRAIPYIKVVEATDGLDGMKQLYSVMRVDLVLVSKGPPGVPGAAKFVRPVRLIQHYKTMPILVLSDDLADDDTKQAMAFGANACVDQWNEDLIVSTAKRFMSIA